MSDQSAAFPLPYDASDEERAQARALIGKHTRIVSEDPHALHIAGRAIGQTGPIWHFQYVRMYQLPTGFLVAGRDLREGVKVGYAATAEELPRCLVEHEGVQELIADELRFRGVLGSERATA